VIGGVIAYYASLWGSVEEFARTLDRGGTLFADYWLRFHPVGRDFLTTGTVYPGYYYSAFFVLLLLPFGSLPVAVAGQAWGLFESVCTVGLLLLPGRFLLRRSRLVFYLYLLVFLTSLPVLHNFKWGQVSVPLTLGVLGCLFLHRKGFGVAAAIVLAVTVAVKFYTGIFLIYFIAKRDYRSLSAFGIATLVFALVLPSIVLGPSRTFGVYRQMASNLDADRGRIVQGVNSQYLPSVVERWTYMARGARGEISEEASPTRSFLRVVGYALCALHVFVVFLISKRGLEGEPIWAFALLAGSLPFVIPTSWPHYFAHLPFFQAWVAWEAFRGGVGRDAIVVRGALLLLSITISSVFLFDLVGDWRELTYAGPFFLSNVLLLIVVDLVLWDRLRRRPVLHDNRKSPIGPRR
jgi:hypothetical protein